MIHRSSLILLTLLLQGCAYGSAPDSLPDPPPTTSAAPIDTRALIDVRHSDGACSGFATSARTMITAAHCVGSDPTVTLIVDGGLIRFAQPVLVDPYYDRAWLALTEGMADFAASFPAVATRPPKLGELVRMPRARNGKGTLEGLVYRVTETDVYVDVPGINGDSGSPIVGHDGIVLGVAWRTAVAPDPGIIAARLD